MRLFEFIITSSILTIMPGPDILFVMSQSMIQGKRTGLMVALGLSSGLFVHTAAAALGISIIIAKSPLLFSIVKYAGVAYLAYMGIMSLLEIRKNKDAASGEEDMQIQINGNTGTWKLYRTGVTMNLLNPKVIIFFLALFPQFIDAASDHVRTDIFTLGAVFAIIAVIIFSLVAVISSFLSDKFSVKSLSPKTLSIVKCAIYWAIAAMFLVG